ncbi:MAG TPA: cytochrome D1 domain-containing protein [Longimicrobiaceae bacterium]
MRFLSRTTLRGIMPVIGLVALAMPLVAQAPGRLLVLSKGDETLSVVDPATGDVLWRVPSGPNPHEVIASDDGTRAYISNYTPHNTLTVVDLVNREVLPVIDLGELRNPHGLAYADGKVWFTAEGAGAIGSYDPETNRVDWTFRTGQDRTHMIEMTADAGLAVATNTGSGSVSIVELGAPGGPAQTVVPAGPGAEGFDISPDEQEVWVANAGDGTITVIDLPGKRVAQTIDADVRSANRLKITPDGRRAIVSMLRNPEVAIFDVASRQPVKRVQVGSGAAGIEIQPDGARAYVAATPDDYVAVLDLSTLEVVGRISAGRQPDGLAWVAGR